MELFQRDDLSRLAQADDDVCISLYMPTVRFASDLSQNPIRYKNLLRDARNQLTAQGLRDHRVDALLGVAERQLDATRFWRSMSEGLAVFISPDETLFYRLPISFSEIAVVGDRFHLKPLFPLIAANNRYYVLTLSLNDVRLYQGTHYSLHEVSSTAIPSNIVEAIRQYEDPERQIQQHTGKKTSRGRHDAVFHGQGGTSDDLSGEPQTELKRFFRAIDDSLRERLQDEQSPLVLAGVKEYLPYYREANRYPHLIEDRMVTGNPEALNAEALHEQAWQVVEPVFLASQNESLKRFRTAYHTDGRMASDDFHEIVPAAVFGRIDTLFVPVGLHRWGQYDAATNTVTIHDTQQAGDDDLLNYAALQAYRNGATVHALRPENMPDGFTLAATFRYAADVTASEH